MTKEEQANQQKHTGGRIGLKRRPEFKSLWSNLNQLVRGNIGVSAAYGIPPRLRGYRIG
jgi:hypothetical protein